jgi:hypothetical protein
VDLGGESEGGAGKGEGGLARTFCSLEPGGHGRSRVITAPARGGWLAATSLIDELTGEISGRGRVGAGGAPKSDTRIRPTGWFACW